jgi:translocation and assembly module TamB
MKWKRTIKWTLGSLVIFLLITSIGGYFYLESSGFREFAIRKIVEQANEATGGKIEIGGLDFSISNLNAHLYNVTLSGTEAAGRPPLLHVDKLTVGIKVLSALRRQVALQELLIEHPVVHLLVDGQGKNNLPVAPTSQSGSRTSVFDLAVRHAQIINGEVNYNDRKTPLDADLYELATDIHFSSSLSLLSRRYDGTLSYKNGHLKYARFEPLPHSIDLKFSATPELFTLEFANLQVGASQLILKAHLTDYANPTADGEYQARVHAQDFASVSPSAKPAGDVTLTGKLHYRRAGEEPILDSLAVDGKIASEALVAVATSSGARLEVRKLQGAYTLANGNLNVKNLEADLLGGRVTASAQLNHLDSTPDSNVHVTLRGISLKATQLALRTQPIKGATLAGVIGGQADASWRGDITHIRAHSDLTVHAVAASRSASASDIPVNAIIHASYDGASQVLALRETSITIPSATVTANGTLGDRSSLHLRVVASDLHQLAAVAGSFRLDQSTVPAISGSATLDAELSGPVKSPLINAQVNAQKLQVEGSQWTSAKFTLRASASQFSLQNGSLVNAQKGRAEFSASVNLQDWAYQPSNPIKAQLDVEQLRVAELLHLAGQNYPISGDLSAKISLSGSQLEPVGYGSAQITKAQVYGEPIENLSSKFRAENGSIRSTLNLSTAAGAVDADLSYTPKTRAYEVRLNAPGIVLQKLRTVQERNLQLVGTLTASVKGQGTLDDPQLAATLQLPQLQVRQNSIGDLKADVRVAQHAADVSLDSKVSQVSVRAHGHVALTGDYETDAAIDTGTIPLDVLMATYAPSVPPGFQGQAELHATLKGPLKDKSRVEAHISIPVLKASYQSLEVGITRPIQADYANSVVTLREAEFRGTGTSLRVQGKVPIGGDTAPTLTAQGSVDVRILRILAPDVESSGTVALDLRTSGTAAQPALQGQLQFKDVAMTTADAPLGIANLNGTLDVSNDRIQISKMTGEVGGGQVSLGGSIVYRPNVQFNLAMQGQSVRLRYPDGLRSLLDANLTFSGNTDASTLRGRVLIDNLSFTSDFDLAKFGDQFSTGNTISQPGFADTVQLAIAVQSQSNLNATSSQISIAGQAALQIGGTAADPVITGRTTLTAGELFYRNIRYQLQKGIITFDNPVETHPVMNVSVTTTVEQYNLTLTMRGPLDKLTTSYSADPPLATADIINLVARGKTTQESAAASESTDSMIASQAASQLSGGVQKLAGLSSLQIDPTIGGNNQNPSARVAIQQRITKNLLFTFSTDVSQPGSEIVQGEYQVNKRWSVSVERDQVGGVSVDGKYHTRF